MNNITVSGNLGKAPTTDHRNGKPLAKASIAVWQGKDKPACWLQLTAWDKMADALASCDKGEKVVVSGRITSYTYTKDDEERTLYGITVYDLHKITHPDYVEKLPFE